MEVVDAVELSLQKGRTIEVFQKQLTEKLAFRGTMAALGCGLLLIAFFAVVAVAVLGGAEGIVGQKILPAWPLLMLGVLAFFLLLQAVPLSWWRKREATKSAAHRLRPATLAFLAASLRFRWRKPFRRRKSLRRGARR